MKLKLPDIKGWDFMDAEIKIISVGKETRHLVEIEVPDDIDATITYLRDVDGNWYCRLESDDMLVTDMDEVEGVFQKYMNDNNVDTKDIYDIKNILEE